MDNLVRDWSEQVRSNVPGLVFNIVNVFDYYIVRVNRNSYESLDTIKLIIAYHALDDLMNKIKSLGKEVVLEVI